MTNRIEFVVTVGHMPRRRFPADQFLVAVIYAKRVYDDEGLPVTVVREEWQGRNWVSKKIVFIQDDSQVGKIQEVDHDDLPGF